MRKTVQAMKTTVRDGIVQLVLIIAVGGGLAVWTHTQQSDQIMQNRAGCERSNILRSVLDDFLQSAGKARTQSGDLDVAHDYQVLSDRLHAVKGTLPDSAEVNCPEVFK